MSQTKGLTVEAAKQLIQPYDFSNTLLNVTPLGDGHINDTYLLRFEQTESEHQTWVLQRVNTHVFRQPEELMDNMVRVTQWMQDRIREAGGNPDREVLQIRKTQDDKSCVVDGSQNVWRITRFVEDSNCYTDGKTSTVVKECAFSFGRFQKLLHGFPSESLYETIPDFHNTKKRYDTLQKSIQADVCHRAQKVEKEILFAQENAWLAAAYEAYEIPTRVTHNDTKLNNVLLDASTGKGLCVLDLDTVMPGYIMNDFGDIVRSGASTADEAEPDNTRMTLDLDLYAAILDGFLDGCGDILTEQELKLLPVGAMVMTYELVLRFLTDYLDGDTYFKTDYPEHNLVRTRNQIQLLADMERKLQQMNRILTDRMTK